MRVITVGLSGSSSAGKTTLTVMLSQIFPNNKLLMIHADDFCKEFEELPKFEGVLDADSADSVHFDRLLACFDYTCANGNLPPDYEVHDFIAEDLRKASVKLDENLLKKMRSTLTHAAIDWDDIKAVVVLDGFLLYQNPHLRETIDIKLFLRTTKETSRLRRFGRYGEGAALEGSDEFWKTESYFEKNVWRNYTEEHAFLFQDGNVEAEVDPDDFLARWGILTPPGVDLDIDNAVTWAVEALVAELERLS